MLDHLRTAMPFLTVAGSAIAAVGAALWALFQFIATRRLQARQPFLTKQLELYFRAASVVGQFAILKPENEEWRKNEEIFWELYWSELSVVESQEVEDAMVAVKEALEPYKASPTDKTRAALNETIYKLAHAIRDSIKRGWRGRI
jgi:hypothetical protein